MPAVDATCCRIMQLDPGRIPYLTLAAGAARLREDAIVQTGETIASVSTPFQVIPQWEPLRLNPA
jgi:hypothetical protein